MKKSFKTLATFLSIMSLIPNLSSIRAEGESTSSLTSSSKQTESEESKEPARKRQKLTEETEKPAEETQKPAEETQKPAEETQKPAEETQKPAEETQKPAEETQKPDEETQKLTERPVQEIIYLIRRILSDASYPRNNLVFDFHPLQGNFSEQNYDIQMRIIKERSKIVQQNMKKFKERILPIGNKFSSDDFRVLYLIFMLKSWNQGIYRDFISVFNIIDILCISDNYEKIPEVFKASRVFTILHGTRFDIDFSYKGKIIHTISLEHQLGYRRI